MAGPVTRRPVRLLGQIDPYYPRTDVVHSLQAELNTIFTVRGSTCWTGAAARVEGSTQHYTV